YLKYLPLLFKFVTFSVASLTGGCFLLFYYSIYIPCLSVYDSSELLVFIIKSGICKLVSYHN
ncbi:hypothetical protein OQJ66_07895, partial [Aquimarina muelleri]|nr:hypothetical protein [Aquimarina muelleri]